MDERTAKNSYVTAGLELAVSILRLSVGIDMLMHGVTRIETGFGATGAMIVKQFAGTGFPQLLSYGFGVSLVVIEPILGVLLTLGWFSLTTVAVSALEIVALLFGTAWRRDYHLVTEQLIYAIVYFLILANIQYNRFSLDGLLGRMPPRD